MNQDLTDALLNKNMSSARIKTSKSNYSLQRRRMLDQKTATIATYTQKPKFTHWGPLTSAHKTSFVPDNVRVFDKNNIKSMQNSGRGTHDHNVIRETVNLEPMGSSLPHSLQRTSRESLMRSKHAALLQAVVAESRIASKNPTIITSSLETSRSRRKQSPRPALQSGRKVDLATLLESQGPLSNRLNTVAEIRAKGAIKEVGDKQRALQKEISCVTEADHKFITNTLSHNSVYRDYFLQKAVPRPTDRNTKAIASMFQHKK